MSDNIFAYNLSSNEVGCYDATKIKIKNNGVFTPENTFLREYNIFNFFKYSYYKFVFSSPNLLDKDNYIKDQTIFSIDLYLKKETISFGMLPADLVNIVDRGVDLIKFRENIIISLSATNLCVWNINLMSIIYDRTLLQSTYTAIVKLNENDVVYVLSQKIIEMLDVYNNIVKFSQDFQTVIYSIKRISNEIIAIYKQKDEKYKHIVMFDLYNNRLWEIGVESENEIEYDKFSNFSIIVGFNGRIKIINIYDLNEVKSIDVEESSIRSLIVLSNDYITYVNDQNSIKLLNLDTLNNMIISKKATSKSLGKYDNHCVTEIHDKFLQFKQVFKQRDYDNLKIGDDIYDANYIKCIYIKNDTLAGFLDNSKIRIFTFKMWNIK